jgi:hypothetical protein
MSGYQDTPERAALIKFSGTPNEPNRPEELSRWQRFKRAVWPWARKGGLLAERATYLGEAYAEAEVAKRDSEARKFAAEAADLSARADHTRQETVRLVNDEIQRIFSDETISDMGRMMQLANILAHNPDLADQLKYIDNLYSQLRALRGVQLSVSLGETKKELSGGEPTSGTE